MSSKISALPLATSFSSTDVLDGLSSGVNNKIDRATLLAGLAGETVTILTVGGALVSVDTSGSVNVDTGAGQQVTLKQAGVGIGVFGTAILIGGTGRKVSLHGTGVAKIEIDGAGAIVIIPAVGQTVSITYLDPTPGNWVGGTPLFMQAALNRIGNAVAGLLGGPIP